MPKTHRKYGVRALLGAALAASMLAGCVPSKNTPETDSSAIQNEKDRFNKKQNEEKTEDTSEKVDDDIEIADLQSVSSSTIDLSSASSGLKIVNGGTYTLTRTGKYPVVVDAKDQSVTLKLDGANLSVTDGPAIFVRNAKDVAIETSAASTVSSNSHAKDSTIAVLDAAIYSRAPLTLSGSAKLTISDAAGSAVKAKEDLVVQNGTYALSAEEDGIHASDALTIQNGDLTIQSEDEGVDVNDTLTIEKGTFTITSQGDSLRAEGAVTLKDGTYTIQSESEGIESKDTLTIEKGTYTINSTDDCLNAANSLSIQGGKLTLVSKTNDGVDSNGDLLISGGEIYAAALQNPEGAFDTDRGTFKISGGTVVGLSATATKPTDAAQNTVMIAASSFKKLELKQNGKTLITWNNTQTGNAASITLTLSCKDLTAGKDAELWLDGTKSEFFTVEEGLTTVGNISVMGPGGMQGGPGRGQMREEFDPEDLPDDFDPENMPDDFDPEDMPDDFEGMMPPERPDGESGNSNGQNGSRPNRPSRRPDTDTYGDWDAQSGATQNGQSKSQSV